MRWPGRWLDNERRVDAVVAGRCGRRVLAPVDRLGVAWRLWAVRGPGRATAGRRHGEGGAEETTDGAVMVWRQCGPVWMQVDGIHGVVMWRAQ